MNGKPWHARQTSWAATFDCHEKILEILIGRKHYPVIAAIVRQTHFFFSKYTTLVFNIVKERATFHTLHGRTDIYVYVQTFFIIERTYTIRHPRTC